MTTHHHAIDLRHVHWAQHRLLLSVIAVLILGAALLTASLGRPAFLGSYGPPAALPANVVAAEQARLEFRRGEWNAEAVMPAAYAEQARLDFRRGEWSSSGVAPAVYAEYAEKARLDFRRGEWNTSQVLAELARLEYRRGEWTGQ